MMFSAVSVALADSRGPGDEAQESFAYWTADRIAAATPRDLVIDNRGLAYLRSADGGLNPYGHAVAAEARGLKSTPIAGAKPAPHIRDSGYLAAPVINHEKVASNIKPRATGQGQLQSKRCAAAYVCRL